MLESSVIGFQKVCPQVGITNLNILTEENDHGKPEKRRPIKCSSNQLSVKSSSKMGFFCQASEKRPIKGVLQRGKSQERILFNKSSHLGKLMQEAKKDSHSLSRSKSSTKSNEFSAIKIQDPNEEPKPCKNSFQFKEKLLNITCGNIVLPQSIKIDSSSSGKALIKKKNPLFNISKPQSSTNMKNKVTKKNLAEIYGVPHRQQKMLSETNPKSVLHAELSKAKLQNISTYNPRKVQAPQFLGYSLPPSELLHALKHSLINSTNDTVNQQHKEDNIEELHSTLVANYQKAKKLIKCVELRKYQDSIEGDSFSLT